MENPTDGKEFQGNPRIAPTAHFTAQAWVQAGYDQAQYFDTLEGRIMYNTVKRLTPLAYGLGPSARYHLDYLWVRHAAYEARLRELKPDVIVEIGAGLSPRGLSFTQKNPNLVYIEGDLPHMVEAKRKALRNVTLPSNYHLGTVDLLGSGFLKSLPPVLKRGQKIVVITEGVTDYLNMDEKCHAWTNIASMLRTFGGGTYLLEIHARNLFSSYRMSARFFTAFLGTIVGANFEERLFDRIEDARKVILDSGFDSVETLDLAGLNTSGKNPPLNYCPYRLLEAQVEPK